MQMIDSTKSRPRNSKLPKLERYLWKAPAPLMVAREKEAARRRRDAKGKPSE